MFACTGFLYNHESSRRGFQFVTRKITSTAARIKLGLQSTIALGNVEALRDWGYAPDYVRAMWLMLNQDEPRDYVIATGVLHSARQFAEVAFRHLGLELADHLVIDPNLFRPSEKVPLCGDSSRIETQLGWRPSKRFEDIVSEMVDLDLERYENHPDPQGPSK
jgi:GDPmannose 4,6-dehydratase